MYTKMVPLNGFRVLDLTDATGFLCGKILADLGADVIKVERPGGDPSRNIGPYYHNIPHPEKSLHWFAHNCNKKSITLDIASSDGREVFKKLTNEADFIIETFSPGFLEKLSLGYQTLSEINPKIIMTSITPFGQNGPYSHYKSADITLMSMGGFLYITGDPDRAPVRISFPQSWLLASAQAAAMTMIAFYYRQTSGKGQHVDVSAQASITWCTSTSVPFWLTAGYNRVRQGSAIEGMKAVRQRGVWECKDGLVSFVVFGGRRGTRDQDLVVKWMDEKGMADDFIRNFNWSTYDIYLATQEEHNRLEDYFAKFLLLHTKEELYHEGIKRGFMMYPLRSPDDVNSDVHLKARDYWVEVEHPELSDTITYPGTFFKSTAFSPKTVQRPPRIGEHNNEVYNELGFSTKEIIDLKQAGAI